MTTTPTTTTTDVPAPAGAKEILNWKSEDGVTSRLFFGATSDFEVQPEPFDAALGYCAFVTVNVAGTQWADGTIKRWIDADARGQLTAQDARQLAADLIAAADELDELAD